MHLIEMIAWICVGFVPTLGFGNIFWSRFDRRKTNPWSV